jgi:hypothetical protein
MSNSNSIWSDKETARWFVIQLHGHEGPYSIRSLQNLFEKQQLSGTTSVWAEGLEHPVALMKLLRLKVEVVEVPEDEEVEEVEEFLPDLPVEEDDVPPIPLPEVEEVPETPKKKEVRIPGSVIAAILVLALGFLFVHQWLKSFEEFKISRYPKMSVELHDKILKSFHFEGWKKAIFFREFVAQDLSKIWLVTSGFEACKVDVQFLSIKDKLLSKEDVMIQFSSSGELRNHVAEFSKFEFQSGHKIIPGMYEMDLKAQECHWGSFVSRVANLFSSPEEVYQARTRVILYSKGPEDYQKILDLLLQKKEKETQKLLQIEENFWSEIQQKLQTLDAVSLQIESFFLEFLTLDPKNFQKNLKDALGIYTKKFGHSLTRFVVTNEDDFKRFTVDELKFQKNKNYEEIIRVTAKNIGFESMTIIEDLQKLKSPKASDLAQMRDRVKKTFPALHESIGRKILQVSEDRQP